MRSEELPLYAIGTDASPGNDYVGYQFYSWRIKPALNEPNARILTDNKWIFHQIARAFHLPTPSTFALFDPEFGLTTDGEPCQTVEHVLGVLHRHRPGGIVVKPAGGIRGDDLCVFEAVDYDVGKARRRTGGLVDLAAELRKLPAIRRRSCPGYVVQEMLVQHPLIAELYPHTINTVRLVTHMTKSGAVQTPFAVLRLGRAGSLTDSWDKGGVAVAVDPETGRLSSGIIKPKHGGGRVDAHPDTGVSFIDRTLPMWSDVLAICTRAAKVLPGVRSIGWDIVIGTQGPVILEANEEWSLIMVQAHTDGWLSLPGVREDLEKFGIRCPPGRPWRPIILPRMAAYQASLLVRSAKRHASDFLRNWK